MASFVMQPMRGLHAMQTIAGFAPVVLVDDG